MDVQVVWFRSDLWTRGESAEWCEEHGFSTAEYAEKLDDNGELTHHKWVQFSSEEAKDNTFRTISDDFPFGISATVCERKNVKQMYLDAIDRAIAKAEACLA